MKRKTFLLAVFALLFSAQWLAAQTLTDQMAKDWERAKAYTKAYLDAMPDSGYKLKPTPEMRSFAGQMLHLTDANYAFAAAASGQKSTVGELEKTTTDLSKANITKLVLAGYDFAIAAVKKTSAAKLNEKVKLFGQFEMTRLQAFEKAFEHQTHHRGQTTVYLRLAGAKPPQEMLF